MSAHFIISVMAYGKPSDENLSPAPILIGFTMLWSENFSRSNALSTAKFASDVSRVLSFGLANANCHINSAIAVDLPVPGGP